MKCQTWISRLALLAGVSLLCSSLSLRAQDSEDDLFSYAGGGEVEEVQRLLDQGVSPNAADEDGETALMFGVGSAVPEVVKVLLEAGAEVDARDNDGKSALDHAKWYRLVEMAELLEEAAD